jgi:hypothetical protein
MAPAAGRHPELPPNARSHVVLSRNPADSRDVRVTPATTPATAWHEAGEQPAADASPWPAATPDGSEPIIDVMTVTVRQA